MNAVEAYVQLTDCLITDDGEVTEPSIEKFLRDYLQQFSDFIGRVFTAIPRNP